MTMRSAFICTNNEHRAITAAPNQTKVALLVKTCPKLVSVAFSGMMLPRTNKLTVSAYKVIPNRQELIKTRIRRNIVMIV